MIVAIALAFALVAYHPPTVLFALFVVYGLSGYAMYAYRKAKGKPVSVIATSTDKPDEEACTAEKAVLDCAPMTFPTAITLALLPGVQRAR